MSEQVKLSAGEYAEQAHYGQFRKYTGEPYIVHPERVALRVSAYTEDQNVIDAAWLHDVIEDCDISYDQLENYFNGEVAWLVLCLTNKSKDFDLNRTQRKALDRSMIRGKGPKVHLIKVIDRIDNLQDIDQRSGSFGQLYAKESLALADALIDAPPDLLKELRSLAGEILSGKYPGRNS